MFEEMSLADRLAMAKAKTSRVLDHVLYLLKLHENNAIVVYSPTLSSQIPTSFAAHAFNVFQRGMHQIEIVRLCALWDRAEAEKENILTVIELIDHPDVIESLGQETATHWQGNEVRLLNSPDDPELRELVLQEMRNSEKRFGEEQAQKARDGLRWAIAESRAILASPKYASIMNLRNKSLAHSLSETRRENVGSVAPMKYGDERDVLEATLPIVETLYCWVAGASFSLRDSRNIHRKNAQALWGSLHV
jgi:AbiU2